MFNGRSNLIARQSDQIPWYKWISFAKPHCEGDMILSNQKIDVLIVGLVWVLLKNVDG